VPGSPGPAASSPPIDVPGAQATNAYDINAEGQIVRIYVDTGTIRGFVRDLDGDYTRIDVPDAPLTFPYGINNRGQVVGFYLDADLVRHGFLFEDGAITTFDHPLASADTQSHDLNDGARSSGSMSARRRTPSSRRWPRPRPTGLRPAC
jgi:probable HAF family extracellular repeat protein